jgi:hypothetical protein
MIVLYKHMEINRADRKNRAFVAADKMAFDGDVQAFQIRATGVIRELTAAKCTVVDYFLHRMMRAFDGKNKSIQYKIANDMNSMVIDKDSNIYDMIQSYITVLTLPPSETVDKVKCTLLTQVKDALTVTSEDTKRKTAAERKRTTPADQIGSGETATTATSKGTVKRSVARRNRMQLQVPQVDPRLVREATTRSSSSSSQPTTRAVHPLLT